jgi:hypothetical protein
MEGTGSLDGHFRVAGVNKSIDVDCYPLFNILQAVNLTALDALILDVEGAELGILQTIPWDYVDIKVIALLFLY